MSSRATLRSYHLRAKTASYHKWECLHNRRSVQSRCHTCVWMQRGLWDPWTWNYHLPWSWYVECSTFPVLHRWVFGWCVWMLALLFTGNISMRQAVSQVLSVIFLFFFFQKRGSFSFTFIGFENKNRWKYCFKTLNSMGCLTLSNLSQYPTFRQMNPRSRILISWKRLHFTGDWWRRWTVGRILQRGGEGGNTVSHIG